jgi:hypothetical protein
LKEKSKRTLWPTQQFLNAYAVGKWHTVRTMQPMFVIIAVECIGKDNI